ncbi:MAG: 1,4-dihydroxy-2-naphthoate polyprenyltransferase [Acidimicrobiia bacterium]|nr:1,4-dihydroxy-2-naphthoate polyprenyltransferase [Acidimicrobiia bacterium]
MTTAAEWVAGARPRTLGLAIAPVVLGTAAATTESDLRPARALLALLVAIALQVGVNYANDYADGIRGTDADRRGPMRLTATGTATPAAVKRAAIIALGLGAGFGLVLSVIVDLRLLLLGVASIAAAWGYTGGRRPYGYAGWGEVAVLAFFGFAACAGSAYVQDATVPAAAWWGSLVVGLPACAVLLVNNIRDVETDTVAGKRTLAVRFGRPFATRLFVGCLVGSLVSVIAIAIGTPSAAVGLVAVVFALGPIRLVVRRSDPPSLVAALVGTVRFTIVVALLTAIGLGFG